MTPEIKTLLHEISHAVDDKLHGLRGGQHADQEVIAEFSAGTLGRLLGYDLPVGNIQAYIKSYDPNLKELLSHFNRVEKVVNWIIERTTAKVVLQEQALFDPCKLGAAPKSAINAARALARYLKCKGYQVRTYDPAAKLRRGQRTLSSKFTQRQHKLPVLQPPKHWLAAMIEGINKRSDVRDAREIVKNIWKRLSISKRIEISKQDAAGKQFKYDLPLPEDHATKGIGTARIVKPFNLAEVQANISRAAYDQLAKSGLFKRMKRQDGSIALVKRCKSKDGNCNIFLDRG